jgi:1-acyl-sn-glycerol-3-phosphate acyltransferase
MPRDTGVTQDDASKRKRPAARAKRGAEASAEAAPPSDDAASADKTGRRVAVRAPVGSKRKTPRPAAAAAEPAADNTPAAEPPAKSQVTESHVAVPPPPPDTASADSDTVVHDMERDLVGLLRDIDGAPDDADARMRAAEAIGRIAARLYPEAPGVARDEEGLLNGARQLLSTDYYLRQWSRLGMRGRAEQVDDFGLDATYESRVQPALDLLYQRYFRVQISGAEHVPAEGGALLVCNHSGTLPWDGVMLKTALRNAQPGRRGLRWLTDDFVFHSPFLGAWLNRIGAVRACPENAERLLERRELLAVFPEGVKGIGKPWRERYQLQRFGRGGYIRLALRMQAPIVPCAIVGAEETNPLLYRLEYLAGLVGLPYIPVTPTFPLLGPLGLVPAPSRWTIRFGEPVSLDGYGPQAAEDHVLVGRLSERVRGAIQAMLDNGVRERKSIWFG